MVQLSSFGQNLVDMVQSLECDWSVKRCVSADQKTGLAIADRLCRYCISKGRLANALAARNMDRFARGLTQRIQLNGIQGDHTAPGLPEYCAELFNLPPASASQAPVGIQFTHSLQNANTRVRPSLHKLV